MAPSDIFLRCLDQERKKKKIKKMQCVVVLSATNLFGFLSPAVIDGLSLSQPSAAANTHTRF